jgi:hypothetical protein
VINGSSRNKVETNLGSEKSGPEFGPDKRCKEESTLKEVKRGRTALSLDGLMIIAKDAN